MKRIFLGLVFAFWVGELSSQTLLVKVPMEEQVTASSLVVEGKVVAKKSFWDAKKENIYTANTIEIFKNFKGASSTTISVITLGGTVDLEMQTVTPSLQLSMGDVGVFFLNKASAKQQSKTNILSYNTFSGVQGFYKYNVKINSVSNPFFFKKGIPNIYQEIIKLTNEKYKVVAKFNTKTVAKSSKSATISSFTPTTVNAGTKTVITIDGSGFGATQGTVFFTNADDGGATFLSALDSEVVAWSDTQIQVQVPPKAGTGPININGTATSGTSLSVPFAVINVNTDALNSGTFVNYRSQHVNDDANGGYTWQMFTDFYNNTAARASFLRALDTWRCESGINWRIGEITSTDVVASDGVNIVRFDNGSELPNGTLGRCTSRFSGCFINGGTDLEWYVAELDIVFDDGQNWAYSGTPTFSQFDFESVAVHELGHAHQLGHVIDNSKIMHYALSNGSFNRNLSTDDIAGAANVQNLSTTTTVCSRPLMTNFACNTWQGTTSTAWNTASNWSTNSVPDTNTKVILGNATNQPTIASGESINIPDLEIDSNGTLTVDAGASLTISSSLINDGGNVIINSNASSNGSLMSKIITDGNITYNKYVSDNWHLVGSPAVGETIQDIITNGSLASGSGSNVGLGTYNNSFFDATTKSWQYVNASSTGSFDSGQGYSLLRSSAGTVPFTGTLETDNLTYTITEGSQNSWNLLANPYAASLAINTNASSANILTPNTSELDPLYVALYVWNPNTSEYDVINQSSNASYLKPGDGFFVHSKSGGGSFSFAETMQSHQVNLSKTTSSQEIKLMVFDDNSNKSTSIKYLPNATLGLDVGYDAGVFSGVSSNFGIFSYLPEESSLTALTLQCLPNFDYEKTIIPIGVTANSGKEVTFIADIYNFPQELYVYLEDRVSGKMIDLKNTNYTTIVDDVDVAKFGRFFLQVSQTVLEVDDVTSEKTIDVYTLKNKALQLSQLLFEDTELKLFNLQGKEVFTQRIDRKNRIQIPLAELSSGMYIVSVKTASRIINKKIVIY